MRVNKLAVSFFSCLLCAAATGTAWLAPPVAGAGVCYEPTAGFWSTATACGFTLIVLGRRKPR
jgi:hypothetical protein